MKYIVILFCNFYQILNAEVLVHEFKAFHCAPCKRLKEQVIDPVVEHYRWTDKVKWEVTLGQINSMDRPTSERAYCAIESGALMEPVYSLLFREPEATVSRIALYTIADEAKMNDCLSQGRGRDFFDKELTRVKEAGISFFPTVFINSKRVRTPQSPSELISLIEGSQ